MLHLFLNPNLLLRLDLDSVPVFSDFFIWKSFGNDWSVNMISISSIQIPNVEYRVTKTDKEVLLVDNPALMPDAGKIEIVEEPFVKAQIIAPTEYIGNIMKLCIDRRGIHRNTTYLSPERADIHFELPLSEIIFDFYDKLKSLSRGYASFDYDFLEIS